MVLNSGEKWNTLLNLRYFYMSFRIPPSLFLPGESGGGTC